MPVKVDVMEDNWYNQEQKTALQEGIWKSIMLLLVNASEAIAAPCI